MEDGGGDGRQSASVSLSLDLFSDNQKGRTNYLQPSTMVSRRGVPTLSVGEALQVYFGTLRGTLTGYTLQGKLCVLRKNERE